VVGANALTQERVERNDAAIKRLSRVDAISFASEAPKGAAQVVSGEAVACLPLGSLIDLSAEKARLEKSMGKTQGDIDRIVSKLSNEKFVANAKPELVEAEREKLAELEQQKQSLMTALARISEA
jgi:valyl-tRNA synthetase